MITDNLDKLLINWFDLLCFSSMTTVWLKSCIFPCAERAEECVWWSNFSSIRTSRTTKEKDVQDFIMVFCDCCIHSLSEETQNSLFIPCQNFEQFFKHILKKTFQLKQLHIMWVTKSDMILLYRAFKISVNEHVCIRRGTILIIRLMNMCLFRQFFFLEYMNILLNTIQY